MLSPTEFRNAIYLDFEGEGKRKDGSTPRPHMAGVLRPNQTGGGGKYSCVFFKDLWKPVSNGTPNSECNSFDGYFNNLLSELDKKNSHLIYWTIYEAMILEKYLDSELYNRLIPHLFNLHPPAKKYANRRNLFGPKSSAKGKPLEEFLAVMLKKRNPYPPFPLGAAEACRRIDKAAKGNKRWRPWTDKSKGYVKDLVQYNIGDCRSTWLIAKRLGNAYSRATITR